LKILFLTDNFPPEVNAPATRTYEHCRQWVKQGVDVTVITCIPNFPNPKLFTGYKNKLYQKEVVDGIKVIRVWSYIAENKGYRKRLLDFISYAVMAFFAGLFVKTDIIIGTSPQFFTPVSARCLSFVKRRPWVMEVRDLWPESIAAVGMLEKTSTTYRWLEKVERHLYKSANLIVPVTISFKVYISELVKDAEKIKVITNGVDRSKFVAREKDEKLIKELGLEGKFLVGYIGTLGMAHALDFILECAKAITDENIVILIQGDGAKKGPLIAKAHRENISNVMFLPFAKKDKIGNYISILDVALVNLKKSRTFLSVIPSKIFENASMEKPILHGVAGESKAIIEKYNAGIAFDPENKEEFLTALREMKEKAKIGYFKKGSRKLANDFDRAKLANHMLKSIKQLLNK